MTILNHSWLFMSLMWGKNLENVSCVGSKKSNSVFIIVSHNHIIILEFILKYFIWPKFWTKQVINWTYSMFISTVIAVCKCLHARMCLPMLTHDLCLLHIVCMFAAYGLQACVSHHGIVLALSVMLCSEGLKKVQVPGNPCSVQSCHLLSQHDPARPWSPIVVPQKYWSPINHQLLLQGPEFTTTHSSPHLPACYLC